MGIVYLIKIGESSLRGIFQVKHAQKHKLLESRKLVVLIDSCPGVLFWYFFFKFSLKKIVMIKTFNFYMYFLKFPSMDNSINDILAQMCFSEEKKK